MTIILLAAGASTRLGRPKQLIKIEDELLINHVLKQCLESQVNEVIVVLGAFHETIKKAIRYPTVHICYNQDWEKGMRGSLAIGLRTALQVNPNTEAILIVLCDQYFVDTNLLDSMIDLYFKKEPSAICCAYNNTIGVPALFHCVHFEHLLNTNSNKGAKQLLLELQKQQLLQTISFEKGQYDIDTEEGLRHIKNML